MQLARQHYKTFKQFNVVRNSVYIGIIYEYIKVAYDTI